MGGHPHRAGGARPTTPYNDVRDAWNYYLAHENHGRGVVLIGHSQGSGVLTQLIKNEIDGKPAQAQLVSAILMGTSLPVPAGADVGGDFKSMPAVPLAEPARLRDRLRLVPRDQPAAGELPLRQAAHARHRHGRRLRQPGQSRRRRREPLHSYFSSRAATDRAGRPAGAALGGGQDHHHAVRQHAGPADRAVCDHATASTIWRSTSTPTRAGPRTSQLVGDVIVGGQVQKDWGLHLIDANLAMGNLVDIVRQEGAAWTAKAK